MKEGSEIISSDPTQLKKLDPDQAPDPTLIRNEKYIYIYILGR